MLLLSFSVLCNAQMHVRAHTCVVLAIQPCYRSLFIICDLVSSDFLLYGSERLKTALARPKCLMGRKLL